LPLISIASRVLTEYYLHDSFFINITHVFLKVFILFSSSLYFLSFPQFFFYFPGDFSRSIAEIGILAALHARDQRKPALSINPSLDDPLRWRECGIAADKDAFPRLSLDCVFEETLRSTIRETFNTTAAGRSRSMIISRLFRSRMERQRRGRQFFVFNFLFLEHALYTFDRN